MTPDLKHLLELAAEPVAERDLVNAAWSGAQLQRRRSRWIAVGTAAAAAAAAAAVVAITQLPVGGSGDGAVPAKSPKVSSTVWDGREFEVLGVRGQVGPHPTQVQDLPRPSEPAREHVALPERLGFDFGDELPVVSPEAAEYTREVFEAPVRAVLLRTSEGGVVHPVLYRPTSPLPYTVAHDLPLRQVLDEEGNPTEPMSVSAIADDRRRVVFFQRGKVQVLDAFTGQVKSLPVLDNYLNRAGWSDDNSTIIAGSDAKQWQIFPETGVVRLITQQAYPGAHQIRTSAAEPGGSTQLLRFNGAGTGNEVNPLPDVVFDAWGTTMTSDSGWAATGAFFNDTVQSKSPGNYQGIFAVNGLSLSHPRMLVAPGGPDEDGLSKGCCQVLGWAGESQALVRWGDDILAWDVASGEVTRVSRLSEFTPNFGSRSYSLALAP